MQLTAALQQNKIILWKKGNMKAITIYEKFCAIWYHLINLKNVKNTQGGVLLLVTLLKVTLLHECFSRFLNSTSGTKSRNASLIKA